MTAAIAAARKGASVCVCDRMDRVGKKLLATGNGRCNLSNKDLYQGQSPPEQYISNNLDVAASILSQYDWRFTLRFFESLGLFTATEENTRIYPRTYQASSVLDALRAEMAVLDVVERCSAEALEILRTEAGFTTKIAESVPTGAGSAAKAPGKTRFDCIQSEKVILAAGGCAFPSLGSNGSGYALLKKYGHRLITPTPGLVQLRLEPDGARGLKGVRIDAKITLTRNDGTNLYQETGELIFSDSGVSGIPVLNASLRLPPLLEKKQPCWLKIDLLPEYNNNIILEIFNNRRLAHANRPMESLLSGLLHKKLTFPVLRSAQIAHAHRNIGGLSDQELHRLLPILKGWRHKINGTAGFDQAQITKGGLSLGEFDRATLESQKIPGVFAAGEILDVAAFCGGYNLQWAWASGFLAGSAAAAL